MSKKILAIASCRVSTPEQKKNNSLSRQEKNVLEEAGKLGTDVIKWWSGDISSKAGTNVDRPDLKEMENFCKQNKQVKYLIVDEPDRFMRSIDEAFYFEVLFRKIGVTVWYACDPMLNTGDLNSKMLKFSKYFPAEGSNVERITKSIGGHTTALKEGRYTFHPKAGYKKGYITGVPEVHEVRGVALRTVLVRIATKQVTPTQGLIELNKSDYTKSRAPLKMDKFRNIATDPFYAGIVVIDKQVKVRNEAGRHEPLLTLEQHQSLVSIFNSKKKNQSGPLNGGNPKYPLNNIVSCENCISRSNGRYVGYDHSNGKVNGPLYQKYRCRGCNRYITREELHQQIEKHFADNPITPESVDDLTEGLDVVWRQEERQAQQDIARIKQKIKDLNDSITNQIDAISDPANASIKEDLLNSITNKKNEVADLEEDLDRLSGDAISDKEDFLRFAYGFVENMGSNFLEVDKEDRLRCKQLIFPSGFYLDSKNKVYTPEISLLYRLATNKKDTEVSNLNQMVRVTGL